MPEQRDFYAAWKQLAARARSDPGLKAKLLADPAAALKANGATVPVGVTFKVVENTAKVVYLIMPAGEPAELSDEELRQVAGGRQSVVRDGDQGANRDPDRLVGDCDPND